MSEKDPRRNADGTIRKGYSLNTKGRPKGTTGNKHKASKANLENMLLKEGLASMKAIKAMADKAAESGDLTTAFKCYVFVADKYYQLVIHNDRIEMQAIKDEEQARLKQQKLDAETTEDPSTYQNVIVTFGTA